MDEEKLSVREDMEKEILSKLLLDEKDVAKELQVLVDRASAYLKIENPSGKIIFQEPGSLSDTQRISLFLIGKYFAYRLKLIQENAVAISQIAKETSRPLTALSGPMKELSRKGFVQQLEDKRYTIAYYKIREIFDWLDQK